ncbi:MAG: hypothetical protein WDA16_03750 [Candidatus Thermoplasmatota archaeon]
MTESSLDLSVRWRKGAPADDRVRRRIVEELRDLSWSLSQLQLLLHDAHQTAGAQHAFLLPRIEARLPIFDAGLRYRLVLTQLDEPRLALMDEDGQKVADITIV